MKKTVLLLLSASLIWGTAGCGFNEKTAPNVSEPVSVIVAADDSQSSAAENSPSEVAEIIPEDETQQDNNWQFDTPENRGVDSAMLKSFHDAIVEVDIRSAITVKDGYIIDEYYKDGYADNSVFGLASCTKSFSGALVGIAIDQGLISGVDAKLTRFFPQLASEENADKQDITVEHLLTHTSGIYWSEWAGGTYFRQLTKSENWVDFVLGQKMASEPGTVFNYSTGGSHLLGAVLQEAAGKTAFEFGTEYLFSPLGMDSVRWRSDPQGITDGGNGIQMTARDAAKFGQLYLDGGKWKGKQIIPQKWVELSTAYQAAGSPGTGEYGYSWWLKSFGGYDAYYAMGHGGQYIFVVPEIRLVTVITSSFTDTYAPQYYFNDYVIPACAQENRG